MPVLAALDYGGILWWTQYALALGVVFAFCLSMVTLSNESAYGKPRHLLILAPMALWCLFTYFQSTPLDAGLVESLSPGSHAAYTSWLEPILGQGKTPETFSISIYPDATRHNAAWILVLCLASFAALRVFKSRASVITLLSGIALTGAGVAIIGLLKMVAPELEFFRMLDDRANTFGTFINRNNAALTMNFGLGASLGLLGWRLSALSDQELDSHEMEWNEFFSLTSDRDSLIGLCCIVPCLMGLATCGSRGGLVSLLAGLILAFGWMRSRRNITSGLIVGTVIIAAAALLLVPFSFNLESIRRLKLLSEDSDTILSNGRMEHWPESIAAGLEYLPAGSGMGTYADAYLPFQTPTSKSWFHHADNLWLELFVEQGIVGICFAIFLTLVLVVNLQKLRHSNDSLGHGLRIAGWYVFGAVVISQTFDFGLILPTNSLLLILVVCAVVTQAAEVPLLLPEGKEPSKLQALGQSARLRLVTTPVCWALGIAFAIYTLPSLNRLYADAAVESSMTVIKSKLVSIDNSVEQLEELGESLNESHRGIATSQYSTINLLSGDINHRIGRLRDVQLAKPLTERDSLILHKATGPKYRRLVNVSAESTSIKDEATLAAIQRIGQNTDEKLYQEAFDYYKNVLRSKPLDRTSRESLVYLDFIEDFSANQEALLSQLQTLFLSSWRQLSEIATMAAQTGETEIAEQCLKTSMALAPHRAKSILKTVFDFPSLDWLACIPEDASVNQEAIRKLLSDRDDANLEILEKLIERVDCEAGDFDDRVICKTLTAKTFARLGSTEEALQAYADVLELTPNDAKIRLELIAYLRVLERSPQALRQAQVGRQIDPLDKRFDQVIEELASLDGEPIESE
ncbi:MAG: O-antigen ligase family protein [Planctomycetota bacterium]